MQVEELRRYAELRQWTVVGEFQDVASGSKTDRVGLNRMIAGVKAGKAKVVLVWRFDRAARSVSHLLSILDELRAHGCDFCSLHDNVDTTTATGRLLFTIIAAFAEFERRVLIERTKAGMAQARREGKEIGRPKRIMDKEAIQEALATEGSWRKASAKLGIPVTTMRSRLRADKPTSDPDTAHLI